MSSTSLELHRAEHLVELEVEQSSAKDAIKGILHTIFFHRLFAAIRPITRDVLNSALPAIDDPDLESLIHERATSLVRLVHNQNTRSKKVVAAPSGALEPAWSKLRIRFHEKRRKKAGYSLFGRTPDEQVCWEAWTLAVRPIRGSQGGTKRAIAARPATRAYTGGRQSRGGYDKDVAIEEDETDSDVSRSGSDDRDLLSGANDEDRTRFAAETSLRDAVMQVIDIASQHKDHIPPIMSTEENPFPYDIVVLPEENSAADIEKHSPDGRGSRRTGVGR